MQVCAGIARLCTLIAVKDLESLEYALRRGVMLPRLCLLRILLKRNVIECNVIECNVHDGHRTDEREWLRDVAAVLSQSTWSFNVIHQVTKVTKVTKVD